MSQNPALWFLIHHTQNRKELKIEELEAEFGNHVGYALWWKTQEFFAEDKYRGVVSMDSIKAMARSLNDTTNNIVNFISKCVELNMIRIEQDSYVIDDIAERWEECVNTREKQRKGGLKSQEVQREKRESKSKPTGGGKSEPQEQAAPPAESEPKPKKEKKKPEPEPDVELTTEGMALRSDVIAYTYDLDLNEDLIEMTNKEWNRIAERHGDDAELRCRFYYEWKASKLVNGKRFKNLDFHTINTASWINDKVYLSRRHNGKSNKQLTGAPLEPGTGRAALLHGD